MKAKHGYMIEHAQLIAGSMISCRRSDRLTAYPGVQVKLQCFRCRTVLAVTLTSSRLLLYYLKAKNSACDISFLQVLQLLCRFCQSHTIHLCKHVARVSGNLFNISCVACHSLSSQNLWIRQLPSVRFGIIICPEFTTEATLLKSNPHSS
jgi:hypothetical protein